MAELTEELIRDLSRIFESAVARGLTEGAKKALKDKVFKQLEGMLAAGATPGTASALAGAAARHEIGLHAHDLLAKSVTRNSSWRSRQDAAPVPLIGGGADVPSYGSYQRSLFGLRGSVRTMAERMERYAPLGPPSLHFPSVQPDSAPVQHYTHPGVGVQHAAANPRRFFEQETIAGTTIPLAQQTAYLRLTRPASTAGPVFSVQQGAPLTGVQGRAFDALRALGAPNLAQNSSLGSQAAWLMNNPDLLKSAGPAGPMLQLGPGGGAGPGVGDGGGNRGWVRYGGAMVRAGGALQQNQYGGPMATVDVGGAALGGSGGGGFGGAGGWLRGMGGAMRGAGAWAAGRARGFMSAAWKGIATRFLNPANIAIATGAALLSPLWGSMDGAAATDDQLWDAARPLMGHWSAGEYIESVEKSTYNMAPIEGGPETPNRPGATTTAQTITRTATGQRGYGDWGEVMGGYRSKTALFADMASRGYSKRQVIEMVGSAARGVRRGGMRREMDLQARIHGYVTPAISGEWLHQEAMGGFASGAGIENSLRDWIGMPGFARKGQDMLSLESQMAAAFQSGGAQSFDQGVFRAGVAGARGLGLTMGTAVALQQKTSMAGLGVSTGGTGQTQEDLWRLHLLGGLDLTQGYVSPEMMLRSRRSAETAKYEDVLARAKKMGGSGDLGKLYAQDFMQVAGVPISVSALEATPGAAAGEHGTYIPGRGSRTRDEIDAANIESIETLAAYDASAASGAVKTKLAEVKGLLSKLYKVIADLAGAQ